jgi:hypothetical protein
MNVTIEKITNGYVVSIDGKKTFCDVPEAICGLTSEWVLAECQRLEKPKPEPDLKSQLAMAVSQMDGRIAKLEMIGDAVDRHWSDAFKHRMLDRFFGKPPVDID